jgi:hypothetical protein
MTETPPPPARLCGKSAVSRLVHHLVRYPADVIDIRRLMHRFQASVADVQQALQWFEQGTRPQEGESREA